MYPLQRARFDPLVYLTRFIDCIEINSSFYRIPSEKTAASWARRIRNSGADFRLTLKLYQGFTHRSDSTESDRSALHRALEPLVNDGILGGVLVQFPWSFKQSKENHDSLDRLLGWFDRYPLVIEVRHESWNDSRFRDSLRSKRVGLCNIDQPVVGKSLRPSQFVTSQVGYVRLHGRNYDNWFAEDAGRDERYDYLYDDEELDPWLDRIGEIQRQASETFVITNNHFRGQAVVNALQIRYKLAKKKLAAPATLIAAYPQLESSCQPEDPPEPAQLGLFD